MILIHTKKEALKIVRELKQQGKKIGFAPTMGSLHEGHLTLFRKTKEYADVVFSSIFVNPTQFNNKEDFEKYPRNLESDSQKAGSAGVDYLFVPEAFEMYPQGDSKIDIKIPHLMQNLCATTRPGHFEGVLWVIAKLFHIIQPDYALFGKKDYQQYLIIKEFCKLTDFPVEIIGVDTIREPDGLAMSSRNARLNPQEREQATLIPRAIKIAEKQIRSGEKNPKTIKSIISEVLLSSALTQIDYVEIVDPDTLSELESIPKSCLIAIAVFVGSIRLIDNKVIVL